jgi:transposase
MSGTGSEREVIGGVDTHGRTHHAAVVDAATGRLLASEEFPATGAGYRQLLAWLASFGQVRATGVEGTGSYGAGLFRYLQSQGIAVVEVGRPSRRERRLQGKSDPLDAIAAARAVLAGTATATPKSRSGPVEAIRLIRTTRTSAVKARQAAINQIHGLLVSAPEELRHSLAGYRRAALVARCARLRADHGDPASPATAARIALRALARRIQGLDAEIAEADAQLRLLVAEAAPATLAVFGAGPETTAQLLTTAGDNPHRLHSEAAMARLCGAAPIPASSGNITRHRLHRGGDRAANRALYLIVLNRLRWHPPTRAYVQRRTAEGKTKKEIIRCLKRALVRELYTTLTHDLQARTPSLDTP